MRDKIQKGMAVALVALLLGVASAPPAQAAKYISAAKAKSIALKCAGRRSSAVKFTKTRRERDDGRMIYDIEFRLRSNRRIEFEFEIDARTGRILEWDEDYDD